MRQQLAGNEQEIEALWRLDYRNQPPSVQQFIEDDYYLGSALRRTADNEGLWPGWRDWLVERADLESYLHSLVISGAIGVGKTLVMVYAGRRRSFVGHHFWARGYWVSTVGRDEEAVRRYIREQEKEDQRLDQLELKPL